MNTLQNEIKDLLLKHRNSGTSLTSDVAITTLTKEIVKVVNDFNKESKNV